MRQGRRQEACRRLRAGGAGRASALDLEQANLGAYGLALIGFLVMAAFSIEARDPIEAFGLTFQTGTVLLASPELLRPLGHLGYLRRRAETIRARRRRIATAGSIVAVVASILVVLRSMLGGSGAGTSLGWALVLVTALLGYLAAVGLGVWWVVETLLEGAADRELRVALRRFDADRVRDLRWAIAAAMFAFGTLLLYVGAYG